MAQLAVARLRNQFLRCGLVICCIAPLIAACGTGSANEKHTIVASTSIVGSIVESIVGSADGIEVLIPNGKDPHEFRPSARDIEMLERSALVVTNGDGLEAGFADALRAVRTDRIFSVAEHVTLRGNDPHIWLDPLTIREAVPDLADALGAALNRDFSANAAKVVEELTSLSNEVATKIAALGRCDLVTDHDALEYFAARYGCTIVGSVVPGLSTAGEATAQDVRNLKDAIARTGVKSIFVEPNSSGATAKALAKSLGVGVIELFVERLPEDGDYRDLIADLADSLVAGLETK